MININTVYEIVKNLLRKNQQGYLTPREFNRYANMANNARFNEVYGRLEQGSPVKTKYAETQQIEEKLSPFLKTVGLEIDINGKAEKPSDMLRSGAIVRYYSGKLKKVRRVRIDEEANWANSETMPPTQEYPFYVDYGDYYQFYPFDLEDAKQTYLKQPDDVLWASTIVSNRDVYNEADSINFKWESNEIGNIVSKILEYAGVATGDQVAVGFGTQQEIKGQ